MKSVVRRIQSPQVLPIVALLTAWLLLPSTSNAQDSVWVKTGSRSKKTGKIVGMTPDILTLQSGGGKTEEIEAGNIRKITIGGEPSALDKARDRFEDGRFSDCLDELQKLTNAGGPLVQKEAAYLKAFATAEVALRGGSITARTAGSTLNQFVSKNKDSYRFYPATELLGKLFLAVNLPKKAEDQFRLMTRSTWPEYKASGLFHLGQAQLLSSQFDQATQSFNAIAQVNSNEEGITKLKQLAECLLAKVEILSGSGDSGKAKIEAIIKREDPRVSLDLFAHAYNALGDFHVANQQWDEAATAYLHTELLFASSSDAHAEALYKLSNVWVKLEENDRASKAKGLLKSRYKNSYWGMQK